MNEEKESTETIKVVDRRWFTEDGNPRADRPAPSPRPEPKAEPEPQKRTGSAPERAPTSGSSTVREERPGEGPRASAAGTSQVFLELVATLAQQAELLMVGGQGLPRQPEQARRLIDYLGILEDQDPRQSVRGGEPDPEQRGVPAPFPVPAGWSMRRGTLLLVFVVGCALPATGEANLPEAWLRVQQELSSPEPGGARRAIHRSRRGGTGGGRAPRDAVCHGAGRVGA